MRDMEGEGCIMSYRPRRTTSKRRPNIEHVSSFSIERISRGTARKDVSDSVIH
jgi:hypothetical protein